MAPVYHPSGQQHEIASGDHRAVVVEVGGGLRTYEYRGIEVLDGYTAGSMCTAARGQPLIPWPNRIRDGRYKFDGRDLQLPLTEPPRLNAIHGLLRWVPWQAVEHAPDRVTMEATVHPQPGYPFELAARVDYSLGPQGLRVVMTGFNAGRTRLPFAAGQHPYIQVGPGTIDSMRVQSPARTRLVLDERGIPTGRRVPAIGEYGLNLQEPIGERRLDTAFTDLDRDAGGLARVVMVGAELRVTLWMDAGFPHLMLFTGDTLAPNERRRGLGVEPMTCPPNGFQTMQDIRILEPGESVSVSWGIEPGTNSEKN